MKKIQKILPFERNNLERKRKIEALKLEQRRKTYKEHMKMKIKGIKKELDEVIKIAKELGIETVKELDDFAKENQGKNESLLYALKREQLKRNINPVFNTIFSNLGMTR